MIKSIIAVNGQTIYDVCQQVGYPLESIYKLISDSGLSNINEQNLGGKTIIFDTDFVKDFNLNPEVYISTGNIVDPFNSDATGNYLLRQDGTLMLRQDGTYFIRQ